MTRPEREWNADLSMPDLGGKVLGITCEARLDASILRVLLEPFLQDLLSQGLTVQILELAPRAQTTARLLPTPTPRGIQSTSDVVSVVLLPPPLGEDPELLAHLDLVWHASLCLHQHPGDGEGRGE
ncbi:hypothetical protein [Deinococcus roseus]|uniref:Uncharacterized protein n=1 Tax=Deinococcus roseus TaxID=392414 RepID=A0ABQ2DH25_9DEIO|nr:hypothetical protein [Deinococcus roseus]GGJ55242.1 hypothetical protein GCM10008938_46740 [Deinococcus roseus]